jgi:NADPH-dependent 2,4-dienoyl-CoA reductase/sulfur reductase-like enzyme
VPRVSRRPPHSLETRPTRERAARAWPEGEYNPPLSNEVDQRTVVIGAGPYGLTVAAHLRHRELPAVVLGTPMTFWHEMPAGLCLKSSWSASSLVDPRRAFDLDRYVAETGEEAREPIPLRFFTDYCAWFQRKAVGPVEETRVRSLARAGGSFWLDLTDGRALEAARVVVATGIAAFPHLPAFASGLPPGLATHSLRLGDPARFRDARVAVVGSGQSGLESAALLHEAGARVELITRGPVLWVSRRLYQLHPLVRHLLYAPSDVGPAGVSRIVDRQLLMRRLPAGSRRSLTRRSVRPAGASWLRRRVEGVIPVTPHTAVRETAPGGAGVRLTLGDGSTREIDHLVLGTGYRPRLEGLDFLSPDLCREVEAVDGLPRLNRWFESSVPGLHFVGGLAEHDFGALCRFVAGAGLAGRQVAARAAASGR